MLNKEKYNLRQMDISTKTKDGKILFYELKIRGKTIHQQSYPYGVFLCEVMEYMLSWLEEEYVPDILTDKEKDYLSSVIKPFREEVKSIKKIDIEKDEQQLQLQIPNALVIMDFPLFKKGAMYRGMEEGREYTLEELGL